MLACNEPYACSAALAQQAALCAPGVIIYAVIIYVYVHTMYIQCASLHYMYVWCWLLVDVCSGWSLVVYWTLSYVMCVYVHCICTLYMYMYMCRGTFYVYRCMCIDVCDLMYAYWCMRVYVCAHVCFNVCDDVYVNVCVNMCV